MTAPPFRQGGSRTIRKRLTLLAAAFLILLDCGTATWVVTERNEAITIATGSTVNTARLLSSVIEAELGAIDKILVGTAEVLTFHPEPDRWANPAILDFLRRQARLVPGARAILVTGPNGMTRYATNLTDPFQAVDLSDRPYHAAHMRPGPSRPYLGQPSVSRNDSAWIIAISRPLTNHDGSFGGVVAATIDLRQLAIALAIATPNPGDTAVLVDEEGSIIARVPDHHLFVGRSIADMPAFQDSRDKPVFSGQVTSPLDNRERLFGSAKGQQFPMIAVVSRDMATVLRDWQTQSLTLVAVTVLINLVGALLVAGLLRQLTRVERTLADLAEAQAVADTANQAKSAFLANMSHEFRTPLNAILGFSDALLGGIPGHACLPRCTDYLGHIQSSGRHLLALVNDILDLSKIEVGKAELEREDMSLGETVQDCIWLLRPKIEENQISVIHHGLDQPRTISADPRRIRQIVLNLLSNAVKFTPLGGSVTLTLSFFPERASLSVSDTGIGMTTDEIVVAMTPFGQNISDIARAEAGTGLGLPLSRRLAEMHGGSLILTSVKGQGTTATLDLPLVSGN
ncbi:hypothetical protein A6A04_05960 [Paramagnetospirillum marisnigri]|uniref:histidine kinase n=1 Tax=Paramagnetospirillum marisnigri TaxID=1285242 RepID=A0A178MDP1_9PROT|nr:ATP-binding protein [Paramagnetospirillum marisnigri]OAN46653.1 hypothetical protein A6A04_05960 [Paramagnetospirillum marisnigri]